MKNNRLEGSFYLVVPANDSEWLETHFKHVFEKCNEGFPYLKCKKSLREGQPERRGNREGAASLAINILNLSGGCEN